MPVEIHEKLDTRSLVVRVSGKLTKADYQQFVPKVEGLVGQLGPIRLLFDMCDLHGWTAGAMWQDFLFGVKHFRDFERLAVVGDKAWQRGLAVLCRPFTTAKFRYFDRHQADQAESWMQGDFPMGQAKA